MQPLPNLETGELILRVLLAGALGGLIGLEREFSDQPAGFRTHILVSLGAALFTLVGAYGLVDFSPGDTFQFDPTRIAAQVVTGIGFLGAGAILRQGLNVRGLTTAAALWVTAAVGTAAGFGYWRGATATSLATVIALWGLKRFERAVFPRLRRGRHAFVIEVDPQLRLSDLARIAEDHRAKVESMKLISDEDGPRRLLIFVVLPPEVASDDFARELADAPGVRDVDRPS